MKKVYTETQKLFCTIKNITIEVLQQFVEIYNQSNLVCCKKGNRICTKSDYCTAVKIKCIYANDPQGIAPLRDLHV